jgi:hypothetical protein
MDIDYDISFNDFYFFISNKRYLKSESDTKYKLFSFVLTNILFSKTWIDLGIYPDIYTFRVLAKYDLFELENTYKYPSSELARIIAPPLSIFMSFIDFPHSYDF